MLRVFNLIATIVLPASLIFIGSRCGPGFPSKLRVLRYYAYSVIWAANTITLGRLIMHWQAAFDAQTSSGISSTNSYEMRGVLVKKETTKHASMYGYA